MRKRFILMSLVALSLFIPRYLWAAPDNWRIGIRVDNGYGMHFGTLFHLGVFPTATDGPDASPAIGADQEVAYSVDLSQTSRWLVCMLPGDTRTWNRGIMSPASPAMYPDSTKSWELRVAALPNANSEPIRIRLYTMLADFPPATADRFSLAYRLVMVDNKGMPGAPQNGKVWNLPIPTVYALDAYWALPQADWLPILRLSAPNHEAMISEGYVMRFEQYQLSVPGQAVPEPAGLSVMGIGIAGLVGWAVRRRR